MGRARLLCARGGATAGFLLLLLLGAPLAAEDVRPALLPGQSAPADPQMNSGAAKADILDMDIESLGKVSVLEPTLTDPVVEAVSKTPEKSSEAPGIVDVITAEDIREFGAKNLYEVLQWATSVYMTGSFLQRRNVMSIRGDLATHIDNHVLILINGRPSRDINSGGSKVAIHTAFPIHMIERVEVIRGPGSVLYGTNAYTGVVNIVTKNPEKPTLHASVLSGSYGHQQYTAAAGNGDDAAGFYAGATYLRQKGWPFTATDVFGVTDTSLFGEDNAGMFAMYRSGGFTANVLVANAHEGILGSQPWWPSNYELESTRVFVDLGYVIELDDSQSVALNFTYNYDDTLFPSVRSTLEHHVPLITLSHSYLLEGTYRAELWPDFDLMIGALADIHHGEGIIGSSNSTAPYDEIWYGVYMQLDYRVTDWLKLVGGMQGNMPGRTRGGIVPRAGVITSLGEHWTTKFLYGQAFRSPYATERLVSIPGILEGNPDLAPETVQTFDLQFAYHTDDYRFATTFFHSDYFDMITRVGAFPQTYENVGTMAFRGVELENEWKLSKRTRWLGSVTYQDNVRDGVHNTTLVPNWMAKMGLSYRPGNGWNVAVFDSFFGKPASVTLTNPAAQIVNPVPQSYHLVSLNATLDLDRALHWHSGRSMQLQFLIQNLLNEPIDQPEFVSRVINSIPGGPGRTFYGGFTMAY